MSTLTLELIGLFCTYKITMLLILILSEENIFQTRLEHLWIIKIKTNIFRIQAYDSMCWYFCIGFIDFMLGGNTKLNWTEFTNLFSLNNFERNDDIILKYFITNV